MKHKLKACIQGGSLSWLRRYCGDDFISYLTSHNLLERQSGYALTVVESGQPLDVCYIEETAEYYVEGEVRGVWEYKKIPAKETALFRLSLKAFLQEALNLDIFNVTLRNLKPLRNGCGAFRICDIPAFNVTLYLTLSNNGMEFFQIEQDCKHFSKGVAIICPENDPPAEYLSVVGNCQIIALDDLFADGDEQDMAPLTVYLRSNSGTHTPPYTVMPSLEPGQVSWDDIGIHIRENHTLDIFLKGKKKNYMREHVHFTRSAANTTGNEIKQARLLLALAYIKEWKTLESKTQKTLQRLSRDMQTFFRQSSPFYEKGENGLYRLKPAITLDDSLSERFQISIAKLRDELESSGLRKVQECSGIPDWDTINSVTNKPSRR